MYKKALIAVLTILVLGLSGSVLGEAAVSVKVELKDGSVIIGKVPYEKLLVKTKLLKKDVDVNDIISIVGKEIKLKDGSILKGEIAIDKLNIEPGWYKKLEIGLEHIKSIYFEERLAAGPQWSLRRPLSIIEGETSVGAREFHGAVSGSLGGRVSLLGGYPLVSGLKKRLQTYKKSNTIFLIHTSDLRDLQNLEAKYPEFLPLPYEELASYSFPFLYFGRKAGRVRGIIILSRRADASPIAELLLEKGVPLDTPLKYETITLLKPATPK